MVNGMKKSQYIFNPVKSQTGIVYYPYVPIEVTKDQLICMCIAFNPVHQVFNAEKRGKCYVKTNAENLAIDQIRQMMS